MKNKKLKDIKKLKIKFRINSSYKLLNSENREDYVSKLNFKNHWKKIKEINNGVGWKTKFFTINSKIYIPKIIKSFRVKEKVKIEDNNRKILKTLNNIKKKNKNKYKNKYNEHLSISNKLNIISKNKRISNFKIIINENKKLVGRLKHVKSHFNFRKP